MQSNRHGVRRKFHRLILLILAAAGISSARAAEADQTVLLVATAEPGAVYSQTVLIATRLQEGHVGLILNRPTPLSLSSVFPDHAPSRNVADALYFGGPIAHDVVFALVRTSESPGDGSLQFAADLFLATNGPVIDAVIEQQPDRARFYAGLVVWGPGELAAEIANGSWLVKPADTDVVFRRPIEGLWEELVQKSRGVTASLSIRGSQ